MTVPSSHQNHVIEVCVHAMSREVVLEGECVEWMQAKPHTMMIGT